MASEKFERAKEQAMAGYLDPGPNHLNCAQTIIRCALLAMDQDPELTNVGGYLGGGMARMGQLCGALSGAAVSVGLKEHFDPPENNKDKVATFDWIQSLSKDFTDKFGAMACGDLLGCDICTPEGFRAAKKNRVIQNCPTYVGYVCDRLAEVFDDDGGE